MLRIETLGSVWTILETEHRYLRLPRSERGRRRPEHGDHRAGPGLQDGLWHRFSYWGITSSTADNDASLTILDPHGRRVCDAPDPDLPLGTRHWCPQHPSPPQLWLDQPTSKERLAHLHAYVASLPPIPNGPQPGSDPQDRRP